MHYTLLKCLGPNPLCDVLQWDDCGLLSSNEGPKQCNSKFNLQRTVTIVRVEPNLFMGTEREKLRMQSFTQRLVHGTSIACAYTVRCT